MQAAAVFRVVWRGLFSCLIVLVLSAGFAGPHAANGDFGASNLVKSRLAKEYDKARDNDVPEQRVGAVYAAPPKAPAQTGWPRIVHAGLMVKHHKVSVKCIKPELITLLRQVEQHYKKKPIITSGYRSPGHNRRVRGARKSLHMSCEAVDIEVPGVGKVALARYLRSMPNRGGVGLYCRSRPVHVDIGEKRDWTWGCGTKKTAKK